MRAYDLLEREKPLTVLAALLQEARAGEGRAALVSGEAGVGKTSLIEQFTRSHGRNVRVLWGACEALFTPRPLGPLYDMAYQTGGKLRSLLESEAERTAVFASFMDHLNEGPVIVVVEDVHWADEATLDLIKFLGRRISRTAALLIVTYRDDEVGPDHPLRFVLGDIPHRVAERLRLAPLSEDAVAAMASASGREGRDLYRVTGGNPFFVSEILAGREERIPATVRDAVLARAVRLSAAAREVLNMVSVVPGRTEQWLLEETIQPVRSAVGECLGTGMLRLDADALIFRHELARLAIEDALSSPARRELHAKVLDVLSRKRSNDSARLAYHAEQAGDVEAVLRIAPEAARQAAALNAHREAAAHYRTSLRFAEALSPEERALLLEGRSYECYLTDQIDDALQARKEALEIWRKLDRTREEGDSLRWMSRLSWFSGNRADADKYGTLAVETLEKLSPGAELAMAYSNRAQLYMLGGEADEAIVWAERAIDLAERLGLSDTLSHALNNQGTAQLNLGDAAGWQNLERSLSLALEGDLQEHAARAYTNLGSAAAKERQYARAMRYLEEGIAYSLDRDVDSWVHYMTAWRARALFETGSWARAAEDAAWVLSQYRVPPITRIPAMAVLGHIRVRRGDPDASSLLNEARELAARTAEVQRIAPVAVARAESVWFRGEPAQIEEEIRPVLEIAQQQRNAWAVGELAFWLWRAGHISSPPKGAAEPYALQMTGYWRDAASAWRKIGCPYEEAMALSDGDEDAKLRALERFENLEAAPAAELLRARMREEGIRGIPRGPRPTTRSNPAGLTDREMDVLKLISEGRTNAEIAAALFMSPKTAGHHVSSILAKLGVRSRVEATAFALEFGLVVQNRA